MYQHAPRKNVCPCPQLLTSCWCSAPASNCSYKVTPKEAGVYQHAPVTVTYKPADEEDEQTATSAALAFRTFTVGQTLTIKVGGGWLAKLALCCARH